MEKKWLQTAIEVRDRLLAERESERRLATSPWSGSFPSPKNLRLSMARLHELAVERGVSAATLRNYLVALDCLDRVQEPWACRGLAQWSAVSVAAFGRWYVRDRERALAFLRQQPKASPAVFLAAERADRGRVSARIPSRRPKLDDGLLAKVRAGTFLTAALKEHEAILEGPRLSIIELIPNPYRFVGLDGLILPRHSADPEPGQPMAGIISLPRFALFDTYAKRAKDIWQRAICASTLCPLVLVSFPGPAARRRFLAALPLDTSDPAHAAFGGLPNSPGAGSGSSARPIFYRAAPGLGLIVFTSPLSLLRDLGQ